MISQSDRELVRCRSTRQLISASRWLSIISISLSQLTVSICQFEICAFALALSRTGGVQQNNGDHQDVVKEGLFHIMPAIQN